MVKNLTKITSYHIIETNEYDTKTNIVKVHTNQTIHSELL